MGTHDPEVPTAPDRGGRAPDRRDEATIACAERDLCLVRLRQAEAERKKLRAELAEALEQVEHWRTLAEYREKRLVERLA